MTRSVLRGKINLSVLYSGHIMVTPFLSDLIHTDKLEEENIKQWLLYSVGEPLLSWFGSTQYKVVLSDNFYPMIKHLN